MATKTIELKVFGKERTSKEGKNFVTYSTTKDGKKFYDVIFTKDCLTKPTKVGYLKVTVTADQLSVKKQKEDSNKNDIVFIRGFESIKEDVESNEKLEKKRLEALADFIEIE